MGKMGKTGKMGKIEGVGTANNLSTRLLVNYFTPIVNLLKEKDGVF
jgi:hypothetical protein